MNATVVDLRYKTNDILAALDNCEPVTILYHGKPKGTIMPIEKTSPPIKVSQHAFFGSAASSEQKDVENILEELRGGQYGLSSGMRAGDAIIAATATENAISLMSGNGKHFRPVKELELKLFKP